MSASRRDQQTSATTRTEPVTPQGVVTAWNSYIEKHPSDFALTQIMRTAKPELTNGHYQLALPVANASLMAAAIDQVTAFMRNELHNDNFSFTLETIEGELPPRFWNERRIFDFLLQQSPAFASFCKDLDLKLL